MKVTDLRESEGEEYHFILHDIMLEITKGFINNDAPIQDLRINMTLAMDEGYNSER